MYIGFHVKYMFAADSPCSFSILNFRISRDSEMYSKIFHTPFVSGVYFTYISNLRHSFLLLCHAYFSDPALGFSWNVGRYENVPTFLALHHRSRRLYVFSLFWTETKK